MKFSEVVAQTFAWLQRDGRVSYRALRLEFDLNDNVLDALKEELIEVKRVAIDENDKVLVWAGGGKQEPENRRSRKTKTGRTGDKKSLPDSPIPRFPVSSPEDSFLKAIDSARQQPAKSLELRASTSLARLWQQQGKTVEARQMLTEIYNWFTEGFDTKDLQEAKALIEELSH